MARSTTRAPAEQTACSGGQAVYNDAGQKVGTVEDLIISPGNEVCCVIVGAGGFVGIGRHDVAIPATQIQDRAGTLVLTGATTDTIKALPAFTDATDNRTDNRTDTSTG